MGNSADGSRNGVRANGTRAQRNPDKLAAGCVRLLEEAGFTYDRQIGAWLNIPAGRVIAFDRVANRSPEWLAAWLGLSRFHPLFIANGHDVRTVRFGRPGLVLVSDDNTPASRPLRVRRRRRSLPRIAVGTPSLASSSPRRMNFGTSASSATTTLDDDEPVAMKP